MTRITEGQFDEMLRSFSRSAFRLEVQAAYALGYEKADFEQFLTGSPVPPPEVGWWRPWLDQITRLTSQGKTVSRVRVVAEPPTAYQQWELWAAPWHAEAGEDIRYLPRSRALALRLPLRHDWWLLDDERLIIMRFTRKGRMRPKHLITDPGTVSRYQHWRDLAVRSATAAEKITVA